MSDSSGSETPRAEPLGTLVKVVDPKDEIDSQVVADIINPSTYELKVDVVCFRGDQQRNERFMSHVLSLGKHLLKANEHRRRYLRDEETLSERLLAEAANTNGSSDYGEEYVELDAAFDSFMVELKAALDDLAKLLDPLFGIKLGAWRKGDHPQHGKQLSGRSGPARA